MADDPIKNPTFAPPGTDLSAVMNLAIEALIDIMPPGAIVTLLVTMPENTPGMIKKLPGARTNYICNGHRDEMATAMIEVLKRWGKL